jgi:hypothetical protein
MVDQFEFPPACAKLQKLSTLARFCAPNEMAPCACWICQSHAASRYAACETDWCAITGSLFRK